MVRFANEGGPRGPPFLVRAVAQDGEWYMTQEIPTGPAWIPAFLTALARTGRVGRAVEATGVTSHAVYFQRRNNQRFAEAWLDALARKEPGAAGEPTPGEALPARNAGWRTTFFEALAETSNVSASAAGANVPLRTVYKLRRDDAGFAARWREALHEGYDSLEMEVLGHLRDPRPERKMDVASALRLLVAHRDTVARERALREDDDEQAVLDSIDRFIDDMRERRAANSAILIEADLNEAEQDDGAE